MHILMEDLNKLTDAMMRAQSALRPATSDEAKDAVASLIVAQSIVVKVKDSAADPTLRAAAFEKYGSDDIEIDDEVSASHGDDGSFVQAWVWIEREEEPEEEIDEPDLGDLPRNGMA